MSNSSLTIRLKENKGWEWAENIEQNEMVEKRKHLKKKKAKTKPKWQHRAGVDWKKGGSSRKHLKWLETK